MANPYPVLDSVLFSNEVPSNIDLSFLHVIVGLLNDAYSSGYSTGDKKQYLIGVLAGRFGAKHPAVVRVKQMLN